MATKTLPPPPAGWVSVGNAGQAGTEKEPHAWVAKKTAQGFKLAAIAIPLTCLRHYADDVIYMLKREGETFAQASERFVPHLCYVPLSYRNAAKGNTDLMYRISLAVASKRVTEEKALRAQLVDLEKRVTLNDF